MHELLGSLVLFAAAVTLTPGPNVVMVTASAANFGFRRTVPQMLGITLGFGAMIMAAGFGLAGVVHAEPRLHAVLKYAGGVYLLCLAWRIARADATGHNPTRARPIAFFEGVLQTWLNPKAWVSTLGALAAFSTVGGDVLCESAAIAFVLAMGCLISVLLWGAFGAAIGRFLTHPTARLAFNYTMAGFLVLSLVPGFA
jgi:threonine/homoserine/homoserine lactone efflux protein